MHQARLNDAAIALYRAFYAANVKHGIFGGYAIGVLGGPRESKDIDCIASISKQDAIDILDGKEGFHYVDQTRDDYVAFLWSDSPKKERPVLVEIFVEIFPGARFGMENVEPTYKHVAGEALGNQYAAILDHVCIFKGKLRAAAARAKFHDSADLRWLEQKFGATLQQRQSEFNLETVGLAMKRYPELESLFVRIGVDITTAKARAATLVLSTLPPPQRGDVQNGLLAPAENVPYASGVLPPPSSSLPPSQITKGKGKDDQQGERVEVDVYKWVKNKEIMYEFEHDGTVYQKKASEWTTTIFKHSGLEERCITYTGKKTGITFWATEGSVSQKQVEVEVKLTKKEDQIVYEFKHDKEKYCKAKSEWTTTKDADGTSYLVYEGKSTGIRFWAYSDSVKTKKTAGHK